MGKRGIHCRSCSCSGSFTSWCVSKRNALFIAQHTKSHLTQTICSIIFTNYCLFPPPSVSGAVLHIFLAGDRLSAHSHHALSPAVARPALPGTGNIVSTLVIRTHYNIYSIFFWKYFDVLLCSIRFSPLFYGISHYSVVYVH